MRRIIETSTALLASCALLQVGCATTGAKLDTREPIEKRSAFLGTSYEQHGEKLDSSDLIDKLEDDPASSADVSAARAWSVVGIILAGAGGALVGWPLGQKLAGDDDPAWVLAGVGGGLFAVSIPFSVLAAGSFEDAVDAYNRDRKSNGLE